MKEKFLRAFLCALIPILILMGILYLGGSFNRLVDYLDPRLGVGAASFFIISFGLNFLFDKHYLKKLLPYALPFAILWMGTFTWAYGFQDFPEKKHLGDYYSIGALIFALPYVFVPPAIRMPALRWPLRIIASVYAFYMMICPAIYIGYAILFGGEMDMFAMMAVQATHLQEVKEFFATMASPAMLFAFGALFLLILVLSVLYGKSLYSDKNVNACPLMAQKLKYKLLFFTLFILVVGGFYRQMIHVFPIQIYRSLHHGGSEFTLLQKLNDNLDKNTAKMTFISPSDLEEGTHIVVIGESANRDHMKAFTPNYPENTTPWQSEMTGNPDFVFSKAAYSNFPNTLMSLSYAMTSNNQYEPTSFDKVVSLVDVANQAGYRTDWISFHNRSSMSSAGVTKIGERSQGTHWENGYDEEAISILKSLPPAKKRVIFINLLGSHYTYLSRVPVDQRESLGISQNDPYRDYDLTIAYTDKVIKEIYEYAKANLNLKTMVYFSDHGENMQHYHTASPFYFDMVHIPFWVYVSKDYQEKHPSLLENLRRNQEKPFTNDLIFDTVSGIWNAKNNYYRAKYDYSDASYSLTWDNAKTLEGKQFIKDDPMKEWKK